MKPSLSPAASAGREMPWDALFMLLQTIALRYTKEESSSLPKELAEELLRSICYTLSPELAALPVGPLLPLYEAGVARTENAVRACRRRWQVARLSLPKTTSLSCRETLSSIGTFFQNYDARFFAHEIPCDIDYQLCLPVPETFLGVDYVSEYLSRLCIENDFLRLFPAERADALLMRACPDYRFRINNLYSPVATNALGLALAGMEVHGLSVPAAACRRAAALLAPCSTQETHAALRRAADGVCTALGINGPAAQSYLLAAADALVPRVTAALAGEGLGRVFLSLHQLV